MNKRHPFDIWASRISTLLSCIMILLAMWTRFHDKDTVEATYFLVLGTLLCIQSNQWGKE